MVYIKNHLGTITLSKNFLVSLIGGTVTNCFGVVDMNVGNVKQTILDKIPFINKKKSIEKGVSVRYVKDKLYVDLHITVMYGVNVSAIVKSIINKVQYNVQEVTNLNVEKVNVFVDGIKV
ncbi:MAG: Asp23/Gls24 family envelope stress response protein [Clostridiales bacterium]|nr:Asp23/Gls24 family envelope stress response protein [Clostridiales bacterium]